MANLYEESSGFRAFIGTKPSGTSIPQDDKPERRKWRADELINARNEYQYESPATMPNIVFLRTRFDSKGRRVLPKRERPRRRWFKKLKRVQLRSMVNFAFSGVFDVLFGSEIKAFKRVYRVFPPRLLWRAANLLLTPLWALGDMRHRHLVAPRARPAPAHIGVDYRELYATLPFPAIANVHTCDDVFARLRVAGYNPLSLFAVTEQNCPFWIPNARCLPGDILHKAIAERRLYALDFSALAAIDEDDEPRRNFAITKALFAVPRSGGRLRPLAIKVDTGVVYPPSTGVAAAWSLAKLCVNVNDAMHHQLIAHLGRTHLVIEIFVMATMRQLAPCHPVHQLLRPHFEGTAFINDRAAANLVTPDGPLDRVVAGELSSSIKLIDDYLNGFDFNGAFPDTELGARFLLNRNLQEYPYRDDALAHYKALTEWTYDFLVLFYDSDADVHADPELRAWAEELVQLGRLSNFGTHGDGRIRDLRYLARAVAFVIFTASCQHAAVNFPQASTILFPPAVAGFIRGEIPDFTLHVTQDQYEAALIDREDAERQVKELVSLGLVYHTRLGRYRHGELPDDLRVKAALKLYQAKLAVIEKTIASKERNEVLKYEFLKPSNVPQSTNI